MQFSDLKGEILTNIDVGDDEIMLTTQSGKRVHIFHSQDCCETVRIHTVTGDVKELVGKVLVDASEVLDSQGDPPEHAESFTWTTQTFRVDGATVVVRWLGDSNGYYSETVDIKEI